MISLDNNYIRDEKEEKTASAQMRRYNKKTIKVGQFGYLRQQMDDLEDAFVIIVAISDESDEYEFSHYDITSSAPKVCFKKKSGWMTINDFSPIDGTLHLSDLSSGSSCENSGSSNSSNNINRLQLLELLNWKICREDYLLKKMNQLKLKVINKTECGLKANKGDGKAIANIESSVAAADSPDDGNETSYLPESISDGSNKSQTTEYTSTDNYNCMDDTSNTSNGYTAKSSSMKSSFDMMNISNISNTNVNTSSDNKSYKSYHEYKSDKSSCSHGGLSDQYQYQSDENTISNMQLAKYGYTKDKHLWHTLKGELFVAENQNNHNIPVVIKKMSFDIRRIKQCSNYNRFGIANGIKEALLTRHLKTKNKLIRNSIANYIDFFQSERYCYPVISFNFSLSLKEFVFKAHGFMAKGQLSIKEYKETIQYLLWRLTATIHWLHDEKEMDCCDIDICPENVLLSHADFISHGSNKSFSIGLEIDMKLIDFSVRELAQFKTEKYDMNNRKYLLENEQYIAPKMNYNSYMYNNNNNHYNSLSDELRAGDMWSFGILIYFCFIGNYPYTIISSNSEHNDVNELYSHDGYWALYNGKLKEYLGIKNSLKFLGSKAFSLMNGLLNIDQTKRLKAANVLKHRFFNSFYKTYITQV